jgi:hypothetical protein
MTAAEIAEVLELALSTVSAVLLRIGLGKRSRLEPPEPANRYQRERPAELIHIDVKKLGRMAGSAPVGFSMTTSMSAGLPTSSSRRSRPAPAAQSAVAFYDRRSACPIDPSVLPADVGRANFCIDTSLQPYKDSGSGAVPVGGNVPISQFTWDPEQPGQQLGGLPQYPCAGARDPCPAGSGFIGDYFGLAVSAHNIYALMVSTHYPAADVTADGGGPVYYQQQVLATVPRSGFGAGY